MRPIYFYLGLLLLMSVSCATSQKVATINKTTASTDYPASPPSGAFDFTEMAEDPTYGYKPENPIMVGGAVDSEGPSNERKFIKCLAGPNGESLAFEREGSCCGFETENGIMGHGLLDVYLISWEGQMEPVRLYINMYDYAPLKVPQGFSRQ
ncbi:MAG: 2-dehydro-3-deoxyphosphooctonate aldolase [Bacteroidota bacterium]